MLALCDLVGVGEVGESGGTEGRGRRRVEEIEKRKRTIHPPKPNPSRNKRESDTTKQEGKFTLTFFSSSHLDIDGSVCWWG